VDEPLGTARAFVVLEARECCTGIAGTGEGLVLGQVVRVEAVDALVVAGVGGSWHAPSARSLPSCS
jgi:hypothetical protein